MSLLSCNCLNVQILIERDILPEPISPTELPARVYRALYSQVSEKDNHIFSRKLFRLDVNEDKTMIRISSMVRIQNVENWVIVRCLNCHTDCYMFDKSQHSSLFASNKLTHNSEIIQKLNESDELSPAFGIVIRSHLPTRIYDDSDVEAIGVLRQKVASFISQAKLDSEEKVNDFNERESRRISALERRAWNDFKSIISNFESVQVIPASHSPSHSEGSDSLNNNDDFPFNFDDSDDNDTQSDLNDGESDSSDESCSPNSFAPMSRTIAINFPSIPSHSRPSDNIIEHIELDEIHNSMQILAQSVTHPRYRDLPLPGHY